MKLAGTVLLLVLFVALYIKARNPDLKFKDCLLITLSLALMIFAALYVHSRMLGWAG